MENQAKLLVDLLRKQQQTIAFMESCTGGMLASEITNIEGASEVLKASLVTYCNEWKEKFGVDSNILEKNGVYSTETARQMAKAACKLIDSDWAIGITGQLGRMDPNNPGAQENKVYYSAYNKKENTCYDDQICVMPNQNRKKQKEEVVKKVIDFILRILK